MAAEYARRGPGRAALPDHLADHDRAAAEAGRRGVHPAHRAARPATDSRPGRGGEEEVEPVELDRRRVQPALPLAHARARPDHRGRRGRRRDLPARQQRPRDRGHRVGDGPVLAPRAGGSGCSTPRPSSPTAGAPPPRGGGTVDRPSCAPPGWRPTTPTASGSGSPPKRDFADLTADRTSSSASRRCTGTSTTWSGTSASGPRTTPRTR